MRRRPFRSKTTFNDLVGRGAGLRNVASRENGYRRPAEAPKAFARLTSSAATSVQSDVIPAIMGFLIIFNGFDEGLDD